MKDSTVDPLIALRDDIRIFVEERNWDQFHTPKNLAVSLSIESGELLELFQWLGTGDSDELGATRFSSVRHELADILIYLVRLSDKLDVDLVSAAKEKLAINRAKYPTSLSYGNATKYTEF